jgi:hypothetical protein
MIQNYTVGDRLMEIAAPRRRKRGKEDKDGKEKMKATCYFIYLVNKYTY